MNTGVRKEINDFLELNENEERTYIPNLMRHSTDGSKKQVQNGSVYIF